MVSQLLNPTPTSPPEKTKTELLKEIRDLLRAQNAKLDTIIGRLPPYQYPYQWPYYGPYWSGTTTSGGAVGGVAAQTTPSYMPSQLISDTN